MFDNVGKKIKTFAHIECWVGVIASVIGAIALWFSNTRHNPTIALGFGVLIGGCLASWIGSLFTFGFGELVEFATQSMPNKPQSAQRPVSIWQRVQYGIVNGSSTGLSNEPQNAQRLDSNWQCSQCGTINSGSICSKCNRKKSIFDRKCS